jgi:hypothetical protein
MTGLVRFLIAFTKEDGLAKYSERTAVRIMIVGIERRRMESLRENPRCRMSAAYWNSTKNPIIHPTTKKPILASLTALNGIITGLDTPERACFRLSTTR